ncbi:hypothetical protein VXQ18_01845 [Brucella abortus]|nr:hypothetical protein [Brucella abortus]
MPNRPTSFEDDARAYFGTAPSTEPCRACLPAKVPAYDRSRITTGIAHLGIGAFHRAHQTAYTDAVLTSGSNEWGIVGVSLRRPDTRDALQIQDELLHFGNPRR